MLRERTFLMGKYAAQFVKRCGETSSTSLPESDYASNEELGLANSWANREGQTS